MFVTLNRLNTSTIGSIFTPWPTVKGRETRRSTELKVSLNFASFDTIGSGYVPLRCRPSSSDPG